MTYPRNIVGDDVPDELMVEAVRTSDLVLERVNAQLEKAGPCGKCHRMDTDVPYGSTTATMFLQQYEPCDACVDNAAETVAEELREAGHLAWADGAWRIAGYKCGSCRRYLVGDTPATLQQEEPGDYFTEPWCARCVKHSDDEEEAIRRDVERDARLRPTMSADEARDIHNAGRGHLLTDEQRDLLT